MAEGIHFYNDDTNRLNRLTMTENSPLISVQANSMTMGTSQQYFTMNTNYTEGMALEAYKELFLLIKQAKTFGFTQSELKRAKNYPLAQIGGGRASAICYACGPISRAILDTKIITDARYEYSLSQKIYPTITLDSLNDKFNNATSSKTINFLAASILEKNLPLGKELEQYASSLERVEVTPYIDETITDGDLYATPKKS